MRRFIATTLILLSLCMAFPANAVSGTWDEMQDKAVAPLSTTALNNITPILQAIMSSNMTADQKERSVVAVTELAKYEIETEAKSTESKWGKVFDIVVKVISLAASIFAVVKVT